MKEQLAAVRAEWRERLVQALLAVVLWWAIYWRVLQSADPNGAANDTTIVAIIAATCIAWVYVLLSTYAVHALTSRTRSSGSSPRGPRASSGGPRSPRP